MSECNHGRNRFLISIATVLSMIFLVIHMASHAIPVLITNENLYRALEPVLHNIWFILAAWSFLPLFIYHLWKDRKIHKEIHRLEEENEELRERLDDMYD